ncbi:MAG: DNA pilot protein [Microvirus sp.]|nr:MAG: DNA pilot protein [Microvirus sp.]
MPFGVDDAVIGAGIVAGAGLIGGMVNNASSAEQAHRNREFQQKMSSTAHQREVADLKAAGLNPMLSSHGGGASSPSGAVAQTQDAISPAVNSGVSAYSASKQGTLTQAQTGNVQANTALALANARKAGVEATNIEQSRDFALQAQIAQYENAIRSGALQENEVNKGRQEIANMEQQLKLLRQQTQSAAQENKYGKFAPIIKPAETAIKKVGKWWEQKKGDVRAVIKYGPNPKPEGRW